MPARRSVTRTHMHRRGQSAPYMLRPRLSVRKHADAGAGERSIGPGYCQRRKWAGENGLKRTFAIWTFSIGGGRACTSASECQTVPGAGINLPRSSDAAVGLEHVRCRPRANVHWQFYLPFFDFPFFDFSFFDFFFFDFSLHPTVTISFEPMTEVPSEVIPVSEAEVSPHKIPVSFVRK
jgi:hypothetical protein